jgi:hypothetical protein
MREGFWCVGVEGLRRVEAGGRSRHTSVLDQMAKVWMDEAIGVPNLAEGRTNEAGI